MLKIGIAAALVLGLAACGGSPPGGEGGGLIFTTTATSPYVGIRCEIDGVLHAWAPTQADGLPDVTGYVASDGSGMLSSAYDEPPEIRIFLGDPLHTGTYACDDLATHIWYLTGTKAYVTDEGACSITITKAPAFSGDNWQGTFSGTLPAFTGDAPTVTISEGTFDVTRL